MKKNIGVIMGGYSSEFDISIKSGSQVLAHLNPEKYRGYGLIISKEKWVYKSESGQEYEIDRSDFSIRLNGKHIIFDVIFNAIHGIPGESGEFIAYLELLNIKHTSAPFYQMALTCNKRDCLSVVAKQGVPVAKSIYLNAGEAFDLNEIEQSLIYPFFVKPNRSGSSYGISKVHNRSELIKGMEAAFAEDNEILMESFLDGMEVSIGVISSKKGPLVLPITEIVSENDFFDYEAKYQGKSQEITPARISDELANELSMTANKLYSALGMKGFSRSEFIIVDGIPHFIEMNTVPGLTAESILPQQAKSANMDLQELFTLAIEQA